MSKLRIVSLLFLLALLLWIFPISSGFVALNNGKMSFGMMSEFFGTIIVIILLVERSTEVILSAYRGEEADRLDNQIQIKKDNLTKLKQLEEKDGSIANCKTETEKIEQALAKLKIERTKYSAISRNIALWIGIILGILVSGIGIRFLETYLVSVDFDAMNNMQKAVFQLVDVLLSGFVIAGGSDAFNKIFKVYSSFMQNVQSKNK